MPLPAPSHQAPPAPHLTQKLRKPRAPEGTTHDHAAEPVEVVDFGEGGADGVLAVAGALEGAGYVVVGGPWRDGIVWWVGLLMRPPTIKRWDWGEGGGGAE